MRVDIEKACHKSLIETEFSPMLQEFAAIMLIARQSRQLTLSQLSCITGIPETELVRMEGGTIWGCIRQRQLRLLERAFWLRPNSLRRYLRRSVCI